LVIKRFRELGDREALNIEELKNDKIFAASITIFFEKNPSVSSVFSGFRDILAQEYSDLFDKNSQLVSGFL
jgi:hypothetical protein